jgi:WD40 repeat protein
MCWHPHNVNQELLFHTDSSLQGWDLRQQQKSTSFQMATETPITDFDMNPNNPHELVTGSLDGLVRVYDVRNPATEVTVLPESHSHWVWCVRYNPWHDGLILSASSNVLLHHHHGSGHASSTVSDDETPEHNLLSRMDCEETVYKSVWSMTNQWIYATVEWDGRIGFSQVGKEGKYAVLGV